MELSLVAKNLNVTLSGKKILKDISLNFFGPSLYFIIGANGSGKSTLLRALAGLIPYEGEVIVNGKQLKKYSRKELSKTLGYVWQNPLYGFFEENVEREIAFILKNLDLSLEKMNAIIEFFEIRPLLKRSLFTLSGGEAKRVSISSVIVADQPIILFDEPESEMDLSGLDALIRYVRENVHRKLIIIATHNPLFALKLKDLVEEIYFIKNGEIVHSGTPEILNDKIFLERIGVIPLSWWLE